MTQPGDVPVSIVAPVLAGARPTFRAVAGTVVPAAASLDEAGWRDVETIVETALAARPEHLRRQLATFLRLIRWLPAARFGRTFGSLDPGRRARVLSSLERSRVLLLRRGFWGLRTLILMGYYGRRAAANAIGYGATRDGWDAVRGGAAGDTARAAPL
jgi:hypothetical protein